MILTMMKMENKYKYFTAEEFLKCTPPSPIEGVSESLLNKLDQAREIAGIPFVINSAVRSSAYERVRGRSGSSSHVSGKAVDIRCIDSSSRFAILSALIMVGFTRIGIYPRHIHVDVDNDRPQKVVFLGDY